MSTRQTVEAASAIVEWAHGLQLSGEVPADKAQQMALQALGRARYSGKEYFWVNDMQTRMIMHPIKPELNDKDVGGMKDTDRVPLFVRFAEKVRQGKAGFVADKWP